ARNIAVNLKGFKAKYALQDQLQFADYSTRELQDQMSAEQVLDVLQAGNQRFSTGTRINRDLGRQVYATSAGQNPFAAVLSCIDSRVPTELVFDLGVGDIFSVRVAGNVIGTKSLGSLEYATGVAGVKLVVVLGHTRCGAVTSAVRLVAAGESAQTTTGCQHLQAIVDEIAPSVNERSPNLLKTVSNEEFEWEVDQVAARNVLRTASEVLRRSDVIRTGGDQGRVKVVGALYDVKTGCVNFLDQPVLEFSG
ncbi:MAG: carbonic anhydrase, partial [Aureliella sp.]